MELINSSGPHFVRCINPNRNKQANVFEDAKAVEQLRCGGVIEAMRMARASFPCRYAHHEFARTYVPFLCPEVATGLPARSKCLACFKAMNSMPGHFAVGKTLVLMRREVLDEAERLRGAVLFNHAVTIQSAARAFTARSLLSRRRRDRVEFLRKLQVRCLQASFRRKAVFVKYVRMLGIARAASVQAETQKDEVLESQKVLRDKNAESLLQAKSCHNEELYLGLLSKGSNMSRDAVLTSRATRDKDHQKQMKNVSHLDNGKQQERSDYTAKRMENNGNTKAVSNMNKDAWVSFKDAEWQECKVGPVKMCQQSENFWGVCLLRNRRDKRIAFDQSPTFTLAGAFREPLKLNKSCD